MLLLGEHEIPRVTAVLVGGEWIPAMDETFEIDAPRRHAIFQSGLRGPIYKVPLEHVQAVRMRGD